MAIEVIDWRGEKLIRELCDLTAQRMRKAMVFTEGAVKKKISVGQPIRSTASGRIVGLDPSKATQPPHVLTGRLRTSITHDVDMTRGRRCKVLGLVGTNVKYARHLELGTSRMAARPFLRPALAESRKRIASILIRG